MIKEKSSEIQNMVDFRNEKVNYFLKYKGKIIYRLTAESSSEKIQDFGPYDKFALKGNSPKEKLLFLEELILRNRNSISELESRYGNFPKYNSKIKLFEKIIIDNEIFPRNVTFILKDHVKFVKGFLIAKNEEKIWFHDIWPQHGLYYLGKMASNALHYSKIHLDDAKIFWREILNEERRIDLINHLDNVPENDNRKIRSEDKIQWLGTPEELFELFNYFITDGIILKEPDEDLNAIIAFHFENSGGKPFVFNKNEQKNKKLHNANIIHKHNSILRWKKSQKTLTVLFNLFWEFKKTQPHSSKVWMEIATHFGKPKGIPFNNICLEQANRNELKIGGKAQKEIDNFKNKVIKIINS